MTIPELPHPSSFVVDDRRLITHEWYNQLQNIFRNIDSRIVSIDTAATVPTITVPGDFLRTAGYTTVGDNGGALYERVAAQPSHDAYVVDATGAYFELAEHVLTMEMLGGKSDDTAHNNTTALNLYNSYIVAKNQQRKLVPRPASYYFTTKPTSFSTFAPFIDSGGGAESTRFLRHYTASVDEALITISGAHWGVIRGISFLAHSGSTGRALSIVSTASLYCGFTLVENVSIGHGAGTFQDTALFVDGRAKTTGATGARDGHFKNVTTTGAQFLAVQGWEWIGGYIGTGDLAMGAGTGIVLTRMKFKLWGVDGDITMTNCDDVYLGANSIAGNVTLDADCSNCHVKGRVVGTPSATGTNTTISDYS